MVKISRALTSPQLPSWPGGSMRNLHYGRQRSAREFMGSTKGQFDSGDLEPDTADGTLNDSGNLISGEILIFEISIPSKLFLI